MKITHDFHIHTNLSRCAKETATIDNYLANARQFGLKKLGFADHLWDSAIEGASEWYRKQNVAHVLKLKQELRKAAACDGNIQLFLGCEAEYDYIHRGVALTEAAAEQFDFVIVPNSHTHMTMPSSYYEPYQKHVDFMIQAYEDIINSDVSRYITAIAHPFQAVKCPYDNGILIDLIPDDVFKRLFDQTAEKNIAIEINTATMMRHVDEDLGRLPQIRLFRIAKERGCKLIFGSDSHSERIHELYYKAGIVADLLGVKEEDLAAIAG